MKKLGFTLAEVLITLVIIGIVAAMAIPAVMNHTNAQEFKTAFKKSISTLNDAIQMEYARNGLTPADCGQATGDSQNVPDLPNLIARNLNTMGENNGIITGDPVTGLSNTCIATQDGMFFCISAKSGDCDANNVNPCGTVEIDVNGAKGPNIMTTNGKNPRDRYKATIYQQKVTPGDEAAQQVMYEIENRTAS